MLNINNPGNIEMSKGTPFIGEILPSKHKRFATYINMYYGYRQMYKLIQNYIKLYNLNTIEKIINRYAPNNENHTENYIKFVSERTGIDRHQIIPQNDPQLPKIIFEMSILENGFKQFETFEKEFNVDLKKICEKSYQLINIKSVEEGNKIIESFQI